MEVDGGEKDSRETLCAPPLLSEPSSHSPDGGRPSRHTRIGMRAQERQRMRMRGRTDGWDRREERAC
jgi:hypothetical protein